MSVVMITGAGQLAYALEQVAPEFGRSPQVLQRDQLDITKPAQVFTQTGRINPQVIFHTAALTKVNYCEEHPQEALTVNASGTKHVVAAAEKVGARLVYFSTDYVFDGTKPDPWLESDQPNPLNVYGASKLAGEEHVLNYAKGHVVRTSGVFGPRAAGQSARNFFQAIIHRLSTGQLVDVVSDQRTCVTFTNQLAEMVFMLLSRTLPPLIHLTSAGVDTWYGWARQAACLAGYDPGLVRPLLTADTESVVKRPANCELASRFHQVSALTVSRTGQAGLQAYLGGLL